MSLNPTAKKTLWAVARPLASRKVRVALATVIGAYLATWWPDISTELVATILGVGVAVILGIAHEDNGQKSAGGSPDAAAVAAELLKKLGDDSAG